MDDSCNTSEPVKASAVDSDDSHSPERRKTPTSPTEDDDSSYYVKVKVPQKLFLLMVVTFLALARNRSEFSSLAQTYLPDTTRTRNSTNTTAANNSNDIYIPDEASPPHSLNLLPKDYEILPVDLVDPNVIIGGKSYSFDLLNENGTAKVFDKNDEALTRAAKELEGLLPLPRPILVVGMPKTGTTSIHKYFQCAGLSSIHWRNYEIAAEKKDDAEIYVGTCMRNASDSGLPLLQTCGNYNVYAQMDVTSPDNPSQGCYFPQISNLNELSNEAPAATFILNRRNMTAWYRSIHNHMGGTMYREAFDSRLTRCNTTWSPNSTRMEDMIAWHQAQIERVRQFVLAHPTHALIEPDIQSPMAGRQMSIAFGISNSSCWGRANASKNQKKKEQQRRRRLLRQKRLSSPHQQTKTEFKIDSHD